MKTKLTKSESTVNDDDDTTAETLDETAVETEDRSSDVGVTSTSTNPVVITDEDTKTAEKAEVESETSEVKVSNSDTDDDINTTKLLVAVSATVVVGRGPSVGLATDVKGVEKITLVLDIFTDGGGVSETVGVENRTLGLIVNVARSLLVSGGNGVLLGVAK